MSLTNRRIPQFEQLESRMPCDADMGQQLADNWQNESNRHDVDGNGYRTPIDVLVVINLINRFGSDEVIKLQSHWAAENENSSIGGGFHPDVNQDGFVSPTDVLEIVNRLSDQPGNLVPGDRGQVAGDDVLVVNQDGMPLVVAKPDAGVLEAAYSGTEGRATVTKFGGDGKEILETYVCVPGWNERSFPIGEPPPSLGIDLVRIEPDEIRRPIPEFNEVLGAIVLRRIAYVDGTVVLHEYQEGAVEKLISVSATLPTGESMKVDLRQTAGPPSDIAAVEAALLDLLRLGFQPATTG